VEDHHVDRPDVEARQRVKLTGTNRSFDLIALIARTRISPKTRIARPRSETRKPETGQRKRKLAVPQVRALAKSQFCFFASNRNPDLGPRKQNPARARLPDPSFAGLVALARRLDPIPSRTRPSNALAPMVLCLKTRESRSSPGLQSTDQNTSNFLFNTPIPLPRGGAAR
jgi:hypothetical protein